MVDKVYCRYIFAHSAFLMDRKVCKNKSTNRNKIKHSHMCVKMAFKCSFFHSSDSCFHTNLLDEVDARLQVQAKVDEGPVDALSLVLLLLQDEHGVVEQLLQLLIGVVDAQLLKGVQLQEMTSVKKNDKLTHQKKIKKINKTHTQDCREKHFYREDLKASNIQNPNEGGPIMDAAVK